MQLGKFAYELFHDYVELYPWFPIPPSIHKILVHGHSIIDSFVIPISQLGEEELEARHNHIKEFWRDHSRKFSWVATNIDIMNLTSDPLINSMAKKTHRSLCFIC